MATRTVTHVRRDGDGDVLALGNPGAAWSPRGVADVIDDIDAGEHAYVVEASGTAPVRIHVVHAARPYLRTAPDASAGNNLDDLPRLLGGLPPATCEIAWQPGPAAPVFYGVRDVDVADGAPGPVRLFFPSLDGAVHTAPLLAGCGRYPLVLLAHGNCSEPDHHRAWFELPAQLARSGYVVAVPHLPGIASTLGPWQDDHPDLERLAAVGDWVRTGWEHAEVVDDVTGLVGHSWGSLLAARFAMDEPVAAYVSLSGTWSEWPSAGTHPLDELDCPSLFTWGTGFGDVFAALGAARWESLPVPRHRAVFADAGHWDALPAGRTDCEDLRGDCTLVPALVMDLVTCLFAKYLPPSAWRGFGPVFGDDLVPPELSLTADQQFFAGNHLATFDRLDEDHPGCRVDLSWTTAAGTGATTRP